MIDYVVHSCVEVEAAVPVELEGRGRVRAMVPGLVVELIQSDDDDQGHGDPHGHTFRFTPKDEKDMQRQKELFAPGSHLRLHFTKAKGGKE